VNDNIRNLIWNSSNPHQGKFRRTLCVCSAGLLRSPTLAWVLSNDPYNRNVRAAGSEDTFALVPVDEVLLSWAQEIVFVNSRNFESLERKGLVKISTPGVYVLNIPDSYAFRDPDLVNAIHRELENKGFPK
jgi:predicted protein tyrosine phosphatase